MTLTVGQLRKWIADEPDDCPVRIVVYAPQGTVITQAVYASGSSASVGFVNVIGDKRGGRP